MKETKCEIVVTRIWTNNKFWNCKIQISKFVIMCALTEVRYLERRVMHPGLNDPGCMELTPSCHTQNTNRNKFRSGSPRCQENWTAFIVRTQRKIQEITIWRKEAPGETWMDGFKCVKTRKANSQNLCAALWEDGICVTLSLYLNCAMPYLAFLYPEIFTCRSDSLMRGRLYGYQDQMSLEVPLKPDAVLLSGSCTAVHSLCRSETWRIMQKQDFHP